MRRGVTAVKIFTGALGGPKYMTNLKMVFPEVNLIPSGGINENNAAEFIRCGACAVSGARTFMNFEMIQQEGVGCITRQVARFVEIVRGEEDCGIRDARRKGDAEWTAWLSYP
jgi:2-dehydro-3-deoxyphosphogluconate aldolase/(4S)-4-hydroxy-2-oxoglutarate aldolase